MVNKLFLEDFTQGNYKNLLSLAKASWEFSFYTDFKENEKFILWRHDVDFSIHSALELAKIEAKSGVKSTFFLLPHAEFYNILEKDVTNIIKEIQGLGHQIGLHFDSHYYNVSNEIELDSALEKEKRFFKDIFDVDLSVFSFHNTTDFTMSCKEMHYAGLINVYAEYFQKNVKYCSDSNGYWRFDRLQHVLEENTNERLQVLTHPVWWPKEVMTPYERIKMAANHRRDLCLTQYEDTLRKFKRINVK